MFWKEYSHNPLNCHSPPIDPTMKISSFTATLMLVLATFAAVNGQPGGEGPGGEGPGGDDPAVETESDAPSDIPSDIPSFVPALTDDEDVDGTRGDVDGAGSAGVRQCVTPLLGAFSVAAGAFFMQN